MREILEAIRLFLKDHGFESKIKQDVDYTEHFALIVTTAGKMTAKIFCSNKVLIEHIIIDHEGWCCIKRTDPINLSDPDSLDIILDHIKKINMNYQDSDCDDAVMKGDGWQDAHSIMRQLQ